MHSPGKLGNNPRFPPQNFVDDYARCARGAEEGVRSHTVTRGRSAFGVEPWRAPFVALGHAFCDEEKIVRICHQHLAVQ
jgi:hypothetical protein